MAAVPAESSPRTVCLPDLDATGRLAAVIAAALRPGDAILLEGPLGAGKSAFARAMLRTLAGDPKLEVPSPTFTLVQGYDLPGGLHAAHFDLYRLGGAADLRELGWDEARDGLVLVEWPDRLGDRRPVGDEVLTVALAPGPGPGARWATLTGWPDRLAALPLEAAWAAGPDAGASVGEGAGRAAALLAALGYVVVASLPGDASHRRYARLAPRAAGDTRAAYSRIGRNTDIGTERPTSPPHVAASGGVRPTPEGSRTDAAANPAHPALLMATTPADAATFARLAEALRHAGLAAPRLIGRDDPAGLLVVEDLGPATLADRLDAGDDPVPLYAAAGRTLAALRSVPPPALPRWDATTMAAAAAATFLDWWWPAAFGSAADASIRARFAAAMRAMLAPYDAAAVWVHRDYFPPNLMPLPDRADTVGLLDFQDSALGHPAYDLVSLIEDARRAVSPAARAAAIGAYETAAGPIDPAALAALGAQRHLRVAALWVRLALRDQRPGYLRHGPRTWAHLAASLRHPATTPLRDFLDSHVPCDMRANPNTLSGAATA